MLNACYTVTPTRFLQAGHLVVLCHISAAVILSLASGCLFHNILLTSSQKAVSDFSGLILCVWERKKKTWQHLCWAPSCIRSLKYGPFFTLALFYLCIFICPFSYWLHIDVQLIIKFCKRKIEDNSVYAKVPCCYHLWWFMTFHALEWVEQAKEVRDGGIPTPGEAIVRLNTHDC